jgi:hypothetical protein
VSSTSATRPVKTHITQILQKLDLPGRGSGGRNRLRDGFSTVTRDRRAIATSGELAELPHFEVHSRSPAYGTFGAERWHQWQSVANRPGSKGLEQAKFVAIGCDWLPTGAHGGQRERVSAPRPRSRRTPARRSRVCIVTPLGVDVTSASRKLDGVRLRRTPLARAEHHREDDEPDGVISASSSEQAVLVGRFIGMEATASLLASTPTRP